MGRNLTLEPNRSGFEYCDSVTLAVWSWAGQLTSLSFISLNNTYLAV